MTKTDLTRAKRKRTEDSIIRRSVIQLFTVCLAVAGCSTPVTHTSYKPEESGFVQRGQVGYSPKTSVYGEGNSVRGVSYNESRLSSVSRPRPRALSITDTPQKNSTEQTGDTQKRNEPVSSELKPRTSAVPSLSSKQNIPAPELSDIQPVTPASAARGASVPRETKRAEDPALDDFSDIEFLGNIRPGTVSPPTDSARTPDRLGLNVAEDFTDGLGSPGESAPADFANIDEILSGAPAQADLPEAPFSAAPAEFPELDGANLLDEPGLESALPAESADVPGQENSDPLAVPAASDVPTPEFAGLPELGDAELLENSAVPESVPPFDSVSEPEPESEPRVASRNPSLDEVSLPREKTVLDLGAKTTKPVPAPAMGQEFADIDLLDTPASDPLADSAAASPPESSEFPEFARNAYDALEPSEQELAAVVNEEKAKPERERKSIAEKERAEAELKAEYDAWLAKQKAGKKEKEKLPSYLQPLEDDHAVFNGPDSPYSRERSNTPDEEHKFVREISAADLNLMSDVSSNRELMDWEKEQDMPIDWSKYSATALYNKWRDFLGMGANEKEALAIMKKATLELMEYEKDKEVKHLKEAAELYEKAGKKWPDSVLEEDALFYAGECYFFEKNYTKAKTSYKALLNKYSNSVLRREAMERLYCIGVYWVKCAEEDPEVIGRFEGKERPRFSDFAGAKDAFEAIFTNDVSDRGRAPDAVFALANAYMRRGVEQGDASFEQAAKYYQRLYEFYPACKYSDKAYQLAMLALYQSYRGPFYDSTPLKKAEEIAKAAQRARKGDQKVISEQLRLIKEKQAEYLLVRGEYYEKKKLYASARSYYNQLVTEYPESEYAVKAAERYSEIRENPAESDQFALVRPVAPFLPKSKNQYFEDQPDRLLEASARSGASPKRRDDLANPDFTELEKTARAEKEESEKEVR